MATKEKETPTGEKEQQGRGGATGAFFIEEGNPGETASEVKAKELSRERGGERAFILLKGETEHL